MKKLFTTLFVLFTALAFAQTKVEMQVEKDGDNEQYKLKLERTVDGETVVTEKTYGSMEEMKNDPELKDIDIHFFNGNSNDFSFTDEDGEKHIRIEVEKEGEGESHDFTFFSTDDNDKNVDVKVWTDDKGETHVLKNGEEINIEQLKKDGDNVFFFNTDGEDLEGAEKMEVKITMGDDETPHVTVNGEEVDYEEWKKEHGDEMHFGKGTFVIEENGENGKHIKKEIIIKSEGGEGKDARVVVEKSFNWVVKVEDLNSEDVRAFSLDDKKELTLDEFNFYPNPSDGEFNLQFKGKGKPTEVRITDINGKEIYREELQGFSGSYDKEINLSDAPKGIYLLQVIQGARATNKKIIIE